MRASILVVIAACTTSGPGNDAQPCSGKCDSPGDDPVVETVAGSVRGTTEGATLTFKGIPYAAPPVGDLRWRAPQPAPPWMNVRDATSFGSGCIETNVDLSGQGKVLGGSEDCLTLNVWTPTLAPNAPMPVMVFIHGGFFQQGSSADQFGGLYVYDGAYVSGHQNVVFVTMNYRLGALGFMADANLAAADPDHRTGNYGLLDQMAALRWVQANVAAFGGDPDRVMLFGESAGGISVCDLLVSPLAAGLFSRALIESGLCGAYPRATALAAGTRVEHALGCDTASDIPACLRAAPAETAATAIPGWGIDYAFEPNVDPGVLGQPLNVIAAGNHNHMPLILGTNADEVSDLLVSYLTQPIQTDADYKAQLTSDFGATLGASVYARYPSAGYSSPKRAYIQARSDADFTCPARNIARTLVAAQTPPVRRYFYTHVLDEGPYVYQGAGHAFELIFAFHAFDHTTFPTGESAAEDQLSDDVIGYWTRFAATGDPNDATAVSWPGYDAATDPYLKLDETMAAASALHPVHCDFWDTNGY
jgi:para-nitrobenzyl esterase